MSAEVLRAAAVKLRQTAQPATPGPWKVDSSIPYGHRVGSTDDADWVAWTGEHGEDNSPEDAAWIALMHPGVGSALADWLDEAAVRQDATECAAEVTWRNSDDVEAREKWIAGMTDQQALATARAILGEARDDRA